jgi:WD40 repeat protein
MCLSYMDFSIGKVNYKLNKIHTDFIRTVRSFSTNPNMALSASYDKTVKVWDVREGNNCKFQFNHEAEVEDAKIFNSDVSLVTVGGRFVCFR